MLRALDLKLLRDLRRLRGQAFAVALVLSGGVGVQIMMAGSWVSLDAARAAFYERLAFADVFAAVKRAPRRLTADIARIPGVLAAQARIGGRALVRAPGDGEYATARVLSLPPRGAAVNQTELIRGRLPRRGLEALASEAFADARGIAAGDALEAVIRGKRLTLAVVGAVRSPEFVLALPPGGLVPDDARHGILWLPEETLAAALDFDGAFNDINLILRRDANPAAVIARIDRALAPYGGAGAHLRDEQESDAFIDAEIVQMKNFGGLVPPIFMAVAAFLLHLALGRAVAADRGRIGLLKALGYGDWALAAHYGKLALAMALPGILLGVGLGFYLGGLQMDAYGAVYRLPDLAFAPRLRDGALAAGAGLAAALLGAAGAVRGAAKLAPAEAMTPPPPPAFRPSVIEKMLPPMRAPARCIARNLLRWPLRAAATAFGLGLAGALMMFGFFIGDAFDVIQRSYFEGAERQDATIHFTESKPPAILNEALRLPGVLAAEPLYAAPARLSFGRESRRRAIFGVAPDAEMMRPIDEEYNPARVAPRGIVLARGLAKALGAPLGGEIAVAALEGERRRGQIRVTGISDELIGTSAYMDIRALADFLGEGPRLSGALLRIDGARAGELRRLLPELPAVASLVFKEDSRRGFAETVEAAMLVSAFITIALAAMIIAGVAYNGARVSLAFRRRELATLRVLGFYRAEAARVLFGEIAIVAALSLPLCAILGRALVEVFAVGASNDLYQMPAVISPRSYALDILTVALAVALACIPAKRELDRMDLVEAVKARE